jgi:hypothetical protein
MACEKPCAMCPCKPTTPESHRDLMRCMYNTITRSGGFPCHDKHPDAHALTQEALTEDYTYHTTDCVGYKIWGLKPSSDTRMRWA